MKTGYVGLIDRLTFCASLMATLLLCVLLMPAPVLAEGGGSDALDRLSAQARSKQSQVNKRAVPKRRLRQRLKRRPVRAARRVPVRKARSPLLIKRLELKWWLKPLAERYVPREVLLTFKPGTETGQIARIAAQHRLRLLAAEPNTLLDTKIYFFDYSRDIPVRDMLAALKQHAAVATAQPNYLYATQQAGKGGWKARKNYNLQYALKNLDVAEAQDHLLGKGIIVAVIDSQMDLEHSELAGVVVDAFNAISRGGAGEPNTHGTAIGSIIAARGQLTGVAPGASIVTVRAFEGVSRFGPALGTSRALLQGVDWAFSRRARIFNLSFAGPKDPLFLKALTRLSAEGAILIASAGNEGDRSPALYPAAADMVIAVTALNQKDNLFIAASHGDYVEMASPGVDILVALPGQRYGFMSGTSMAAAHISGIAALILEHNRDLPAAELRRILVSTAEDLGASGRDALYGAGRVSAAKAIQAALQ
mgnify:CR=1 FL=1